MTVPKRALLIETPSESLSHLGISPEGIAHVVSILLSSERPDLDLLCTGLSPASTAIVHAIAKKQNLV